MNKRKKNKTKKALVLTELIIVIFIIGIMASIAAMNFPAMVARKQFGNQANEFVDILRKAITSSAEGGKRYAMILDFEEQTYVLKEITQLYREVIEDEETPAMLTGYFTPQCQLDYIVFEDGVDSRYPPDEEYYLSLNFYTGRSGLDLGGIIVLVDHNGENPYSVILNRLSRTVKLLPGGADEHYIPEPIDKNELRF